MPRIPFFCTHTEYVRGLSFLFDVSRVQQRAPCDDRSELNMAYIRIIGGS